MILTRLIPAVVFVAIFVAHALYVGACAASGPSGWTDFGINAHVGGPLGLGAYWRGQDYFIGFSSLGLINRGVKSDRMLGAVVRNPVTSEEVGWLLAIREYFGL